MRLKKHSDTDLRTVVIGIGNSFRGDDAAGVIAASRINALEMPGVETVTADDGGTTIIDACHFANSLYIVDACFSGAPAGTIQRFDASADDLPDQLFGISTHGFSLAEALRLGRILGLLPQKVIVFAVEGETFEPGTGLSDAVRESIEEICRLIVSEIRGERSSILVN